MTITTGVAPVRSTPAGAAPRTTISAAPAMDRKCSRNDLLRSLQTASKHDRNVRASGELRTNENATNVFVKELKPEPERQGVSRRVQEFVSKNVRGLVLCPFAPVPTVRCPEHLDA